MRCALWAKSAYRAAQRDCQRYTPDEIEPATCFELAQKNGRLGIPPFNILQPVMYRIIFWLAKISTNGTLCFHMFVLRQGKSWFIFPSTYKVVPRS